MRPETTPPFLLVASDLHLGEGRAADTQVYARQESFFADEAFVRWLDHYRGNAADGALLVLNGDAFDFLRVTRCPRTDQDYSAWAGRLPPNRKGEAVPTRVSRHERAFGLRTDD